MFDLPKDAIEAFYLPTQRDNEMKRRCVIGRVKSKPLKFSEETLQRLLELERAQAHAASEARNFWFD